MRHRVRGRRLGRSASHRNALRRNLARSLFLTFGNKEHIVTTVDKAKFVQPFAEKLITLAKEKTLHSYRRGLQLLHDESVVKRLFDEIGPRYSDRPGGYTRIIRVQRRRLGDAGQRVILGFVRDHDAAEEEAAVVAEAEE